MGQAKIRGFFLVRLRKAMGNCVYSVDLSASIFGVLRHHLSDPPVRKLLVPRNVDEVGLS